VRLIIGEAALLEDAAVFCADGLGVEEHWRNSIE